MPKPPVRRAGIHTVQELGRALAAAARLGYSDRQKADGSRPARTGYDIANQLCGLGVADKRQERYLKFAYLAGWHFRAPGA
jgi:hypothetical protein